MFAANAQRMQMVMNRLGMLLRTGNKNIQQIEQPLLALARGIDFSVANGEVPSKAPALSLLVKQICQWKSDSLILPLIMALMVSVKNACKLGWFSTMETQEIIDLYKEISNSFCLPENFDFDSELKPSNPHIQTIMERYYPWLRLGSIIACLEVKPGCGTYLVDFHISKNAEFSPQEKIRLFVAQIDNTETSSCLISPRQVNFLLNGKGVMGRVNCATMDTGPQIPTNVTALLKFGTNLLQAVGNFSGNYVIAIAFMGMLSLSCSDLKDYVQPGVTTQSSDSEVIVGPSRVSLNCPISCKRIKIPVKGQQCKHIQCFDFDNFVEINSRRPSWRCPHCNQCVSFLDIRRDQNTVKILNEVEDNVQDVIISPDGSWKNASKNDGHFDGSGDADVDLQRSPELRGVSSSSDAISEILDLTMEGDMMDIIQVSDTDDRKPSHVDLLNSMGSNVTMRTEVSPSSHGPQSTVSQMDDFWLGLDLQNIGPSDGRFDHQSMTNTLYPSDCSPVFANASSNTQQPGHHNHLSSHGSIGMPGQQQSQFPSPVMNNQYVRLPSVTAVINRTPPAVQPLAPSNGTPSAVFSQSLPSMTYTADRSTTNYSHSALNHAQRPEMTRFQPQQQSSRNAMPSRNSNTRVHHMQQQYLHRPMQTPYVPQAHYQQTSAQFGANNSSTRHMITPRPTSSAYQSQRVLPGQSFPSNVGAPVMSVQQPQPQPQSQQPRVVQQVSRTEQLVNIPADSNLRPTGRMRGSLSGRAYEDARNLFLSPSLQQTRPPRPPQDLTSPPPGVPPELHEMISNLSVPPSSSPHT